MKLQTCAPLTWGFVFSPTNPGAPEFHRLGTAVGPAQHSFCGGTKEWPSQTQNLREGQKWSWTGHETRTVSLLPIPVHIIAEKAS